MVSKLSKLSKLGKLSTPSMLRTFQTWRGRLQAVALAGVAIALVAVASVAARQEAPGIVMRGMRPMFPFAQLDLSQDQQTRIRTIFEKNREANQALHDELQAAHQSLRAAVFASATPDTAQIEELTAKVAELDAQALRARIAAEIEVASVLTDEQRQKAATAAPRMFHGASVPGARGRRRE